MNSKTEQAITDYLDTVDDATLGICFHWKISMLKSTLSILWKT